MDRLLPNLVHAFVGALMLTVVAIIYLIALDGMLADLTSGPVPMPTLEEAK